MNAMLELIKALLVLRLAVIATFVGGALVLVAVWSLTHGAAGAAVAVLAAILLGVALAATAVRRGIREH